jgi:exportin-2 (importin alpha re-exporter)
MFGMVVERLFVGDLQKVAGGVEKKICAVGVTRILTEAPVMLDQNGYKGLWYVLISNLSQGCK